MNDQDIQCFVQIRDEVHDEIKKIGPYVINLQEATRALLAQVDVFKALSASAQDHMRGVINDASIDMAHKVSERLSSTLSLTLETQLQEILTSLDQSVQYARKTLAVSKGAKVRRLILLCGIGGLFCCFMGASFGYFYAKRHTYSLPSDFLKMYALGYEYKEILDKKNPQVKSKIEKRRGKKQ